MGSIVGVLGYAELPRIVLTSVFQLDLAETSGSADYGQAITFPQHGATAWDQSFTESPYQGDQATLRQAYVSQRLSDQRLRQCPSLEP